ncbi:UDP-N-acetylmuramoyl-L-alanyl-D-glutamate--2,6-diaminopimelate ligase [Alkalihalobacillus xiaoxiensis]|uniref:UDP-N-acetylmuramyl-tripeptide synthetase n=1 Tax=Shouchella xiaoxiensis TaxID=766895 RepID=A0ABS2SP55_9BACI|nr:UDP-N-acetylmuramoyl-L-alanyl-D-glutamate--2,6-diaminopimelate ligase [Shouchella xiaoxiensis]MBM7837303.1 UDP-N-acetylmuramoyl-L-alanyl-D-glutamate--2,6-diaminopimelate ligase [Shouchella xiaoxiensis]
MDLQTLLKSITDENVSGHVQVTGISNHSSTVQKGDLFVAISGFAVDGHEYVDEAIAAGAVAVVGERDLPSLKVPYIKVESTRLTLPLLAKQFYFPVQGMKTFIGITGTNGKTTTSFMLKHLLEKAGHDTALFGTIHTYINKTIYPTKNTTVDSLQLYKYLAESEDKYVIMEVTSHALLQHRVDGIQFDLCLFTNLSRDHLDYHNDMDSYFEAKKRLFEMMSPTGLAIINYDNQWGETLYKQLQQEGKRVEAVGAEAPDFSINSIEYGEEMRVEFGVKQSSYRLEVPLLGEHNVTNALMAFQAARTVGMPPPKIIDTFKSFTGVPGRFERFQLPSGGYAIIDYAHTEDALYHCFKTAEQMGAERIVHVLGFRGGRDKGKQQAMIEQTLAYSDVIFLTLDDLNGELKEEMILSLERFDLKRRGKVIADRVKAIQTALAEIKDGDWLFITGKGRERYKESSYKAIHSDYEAVQDWLNHTAGMNVFKLPST